MNDTMFNNSKNESATNVCLENIISEKCTICGLGDTGTHIHYGGRGCTSCRAFFRRSVHTDSYKVRKLNTIYQMIRIKLCN